jgi:two-component system, NtrC family, response regulator AtoC
MSGDSTDAVDEPRAFVALKVGDRAWIADLITGSTSVGEHPSAGIRVENAELDGAAIALAWDGERASLTPIERTDRIFVNGKRIDGAVDLKPGDEIALGRAQLVVGIAVTSIATSRRALTHHEFRERLYEEMARAARAGRPTALVMLQAKPSEGASIASAALGVFRAGDVLGTYAHDELEFLLPDCGFDAARSVVARVLAGTAAHAPAIGIAVAPEHGDNPERLLREARSALASARVSGNIELPPERSPTPDAEPAIHDPATSRVVAELGSEVDSDDPLLLVGELSSGKSIFARLVHRKSSRKDRPFVTLACARIGNDEIAGELGRAFQRAAGGTVLLDEIGDLSSEAQAAVLEALSLRADVRVIATTHRVLRGLVERGAFAERLAAQLGAKVVELPPLRSRPEDILPLAERFAREAGATSPVRMSAGALARLRSHPWPGNVLELRNAMDRAVRLASGGEILADHLPVDALPFDSSEGRLREHVDSVERDAIVKALADANHNQTRAAKRLGVSRRALIYKMEKYGLKPPPASVKRS